MLSIVIAYYRQPEALKWQLEFLKEFRPHDYQLIVVDDASGDGEARNLLSAYRSRTKLVTVLDRVKWNIPGARNWGMVFADGGVCLRTDIDHRPTFQTMEWLLELSLVKGMVYSLGRVSETGERLNAHTDSFVIRKDDYWEIGGYDEIFSGAYGQNAKDFLARASRKVQLESVPYDLVLRSDLISDGGNRSLARNKRLLKKREREGLQRHMLRLTTNILVEEFNAQP